MPYTSLDEIKLAVSERKLIDLTDDPNHDVPGAQVIEQAILDAAALTDTYLVPAGYDVPFSSGNPEITQWLAGINRDIAIYKIYSRRLDLEMPDGMRQRYTDAIKQLERIGSGDMILTGTVDPVENVPHHIAINDRPRFWPDSLLKFYT